MRKVVIAFAIILLPSLALARGGHGGPSGGGGGAGMSGGGSGHAGSFSGGARGGWSGASTSGGWSGARTSGGWSGPRTSGGWNGSKMNGPARASAAAVTGGPARVAGWSGGTGNWQRGNWNHTGNWHHGHHGHHRRNAVFFFAGGPWWGDYGYYDNGCWQWVQTRRGLRRLWVCGDYY